MALQTRSLTLASPIHYGAAGEVPGPFRPAAFPAPSQGEFVPTVNGILRDLTDPVFLGPMVFAQGVFGLSRLSILKLLQPGVSRSAAVAGANLGAFALEGLGFVGSARGLHQAMVGKATPEVRFGKELGHAYLTLGLLKTFGGFTQTGLRLRYQNVPAAARTLRDKGLLQAAPQAAQFFGIYLSHSLAPGLGLGEYLDPKQRALHSAVSLVHFGLAGQLLARMPGYARLNHRVHEATARWVSRTWTEGPFNGSNFFPERLTLASGFWTGLSKRPGEISGDPKEKNLVFAKDTKDVPEGRGGSGRPAPISGLRPADPTLVMSIPGLVFRIKGDGTILDVQGKQPQGFLIQKNHYIGMQMQDLPLPHEVHEKLREALATTLQTGEIQSVEFVLPESKRPAYREILLTPLGLGEVVAVFRDTTQTKTKEAQREGLLSILNSSSEIVIMATPEGELFYVNRVALERLGLKTPQEIKSRRQVTQNFPPWAIHLLENVAIPAATREGLWVGETALVDSGGNEIPFLQRIIAHRDSEGKLTHFSAILTDIAHIKKMQEISNSEGRLEAMKLVVPGLVHDINNLLATVRLRMQAWDKGLGRLGEIVEMLKEAEVNPALLADRQFLADLGERLKRTIPPAERANYPTGEATVFDSVKAIVIKIQEALGHISGDIRDTDRSVERITYLLRSLKELDTAPKKGSPFALMEILDSDILREVLPPGHPIQIFSDAGQSLVPGPKQEILRALHNIVKNAGEAVAGGYNPLITIRSEGVTLSELELSRIYPPWVERGLPSGQYLKIMIEDQGRGMDEKTRSRVFDLNYSTKNPDGSDSSGGTGSIRGFGMAITRKVIHDAGGFILVDSSPNKGSRFEVFLPEVARTVRLFHPSHYLKTIQTPIIFLPGTGEVGKNVPALLKEQGFQRVMSAGDFADAKAKIAGYPEGVAVFVDISRADFDRELWKALESDNPRLRVIPWTVSGEGDSGAMQFFIGNGPLNIPPPLTGDGLAFAVANLLEKAPVKK